ncbi:MAG TPA: glucose-1-phosphate thymidylyltransferase [Streptosporangiaceae bacterium]
MKALVLSGGTGTRLRPHSYSTPKQLVPVANKPVLFHGLEAIRNAGIVDVGIVVNTPGAAIRAAVGDGSSFGMNITYLSQDEPLGLAHCVVIAKEFLGGDDFLMYLGDNVFSEGLDEPLAEFIEHRPAAQLAVTKVSDPSQYGIVDVDAAGRVTSLQEKPAHPASDLAITGLYFFTPQIHDAVHSIKPSWRNELEITDAIQWLVEQGCEVRAMLVPGYWKDTGTHADLLECNKILLQGITPDVCGHADAFTIITGPVIVAADARLERSEIVGPAIIGAGSTVVASHVGPFTSIGRGCRVIDAEVADSILLDRASVRGVRTIRDSIIGKAGDIRRGDPGSAVHRLIVGDDSTIEIPA